MTTGFYWDERCFWHAGGNYSFTLPTGGLVQPMAAGGLPEDPETKRRLKNLLDVTGLSSELNVKSAPPADEETLRRVHPEKYLSAFQALSNDRGGELGLRTPFGPGGYDIAALSAGLVCQAGRDVMSGKVQNAYALARPPGHHCLPDWPNGFCLMANIAIAIEALQAQAPDLRAAVVDWDVHHGNGTEAIFYDRADVLTISLHQEYNYPIDTGAFSDRGDGAGEGFNLNIPLPPGAGHKSYVDAMDQIVVPELIKFQPDVIFVACGYDAAAIDPLSRMLATADTFAQMTQQIAQTAKALCQGRLVLAHEGGYSEVYVPFCGHAAIATLADSSTDAGDPFRETFAARQPQAGFQKYLDQVLSDLRQAL